MQAADIAPLISDGPIIATCLLALSQVPLWFQRFLYLAEAEQFHRQHHHRQISSTEPVAGEIGSILGQSRVDARPGFPAVESSTVA